MESIKNLLQLINDDWATIITIAALLFGIYTKAKKSIKDWKNKTEEERKAVEEEAINKAIEMAKKSLSEYILAVVAKAEVEWKEQKMGEIKRSQVISEIYKEFPILQQVEDKDELIKYVDILIDEALKTVREKVRVNE